MPNRIATFLEKSRPATNAVSLFALAVCTILFMLPADTLFASSLRSALLQDYPGVTSQLYLLPTEDTPVHLNTHTASVYLSDTGNGSISAYTDTYYVVKNDTDVDVNVPLVVYPGKGDARTQQVSVTIDGSSAQLSYADDGSLITEALIPAESRTTLRLNYTVLVSDSPLITVRYAPAILRAWRGPTSTRVQYTVPNYIPRDSWTTIAPDTWSYATSGVDEIAVKWLYDSTIPDVEFIVQFVAPATWTEIQLAKSAAANGAPVAYLDLGDLYFDLSSARSAEDAVSNWFRAQAIAAYENGVRQHAEAPTAEVATMHMRLANLYRNNAASREHDTYANAALMVDEASAALTLLDFADPRRAELHQWQADGLRILFDDARAHNDWQTASQIVDQMSALSPGAIDDELLVEGQRIVLTQQALQLMRRGEQDTAATLIGAEISPAQVATPTELSPLFEAWSITATVSADTILLEIRAYPTASRREEAHAAIGEIATNWQSSSRKVSSSFSSSPAGDIYLELAFPRTIDAAALAQYLPTSSDYAFLRALLAQLDPQTTTRNRLFQRVIQHSQSIDLRAAGEQWSISAAQLDQLADEIRTSARGADAETQLLAEMRAANYESTAESWRDLLSSSWLLFRFPLENAASTSAPTTANNEEAAWHATATSPPTVFTAQSQSTNTALLYASLFGLLALAIALALLLWRLL